MRPLFGQAQGLRIGTSPGSSMFGQTAAVFILSSGYEGRGVRGPRGILRQQDREMRRMRRFRHAQGLG